MYIYRQADQCKLVHAFSMHLHLVCDGWKSCSFDVIACLCNTSYHLLCVDTCGSIEHCAFYPLIVFFIYALEAGAWGKRGGYFEICSHYNFHIWRLSVISKKEHEHGALSPLFVDIEKHRFGLIEPVLLPQSNEWSSLIYAHRFHSLCIPH